MAARAARGGVKLLRVEDVTGLKDIVAQASRNHAGDREYLSELAAWSGRHAAFAGVPARNTPAPDPAAELPGRLFAATALAQPPESTAADDNAEVLALGTRDDDELARLRAGEATSLVLLTATALGLASCPITEPLEIAETRGRVGADIFGDNEFPQMLLRIGWATVNADPLPSTPRWPLANTAKRLDGAPVQLTCSGAGQGSGTDHRSNVPRSAPFPR